MRLSFRLNLAGWGLELDFGRTEDDEPQEQITLTGGPVGLVLPEEDAENAPEEA